MQIEDYRGFAQELLKVAQPILQANYQHLVEEARHSDIQDSNLVEWKKTQKRDVVTIGEQQAEAAMRSLVEERYATHSIIGEECGTEIRDSDYCWVFDPIDGTAAMLESAIAEAKGQSVPPESSPFFGVTIGLVYRQKPILGLVHDLLRQDTWVAQSGHRVTHNGQNVEARSVNITLSQARLSCTVPEIMFPRDVQRKAFNGCRVAVAQVYTNRNCIGFMQLLEGHVDIVWEGDLAYHDVVPLVPILTNAGFTATDEQGTDLDFQDPTKEYRLIVAPKYLHSQLLEYSRASVADTPETQPKGDLQQGFYTSKFGNSTGGDCV
jgi:fructose-1,6-bisphosphatase/inositol monophosphatase family enzyme